MGKSDQGCWQSKADKRWGGGEGGAEGRGVVRPRVLIEGSEADERWGGVGVEWRRIPPKMLTEWSKAAFLSPFRDRYVQTHFRAGRG